MTSLQQSRQRQQYYTSRAAGGCGDNSDYSPALASMRERRSSLGGVAGGDYSGEMDYGEGGGMRGGDLDARLASLGLGLGGHGHDSGVVIRVVLVVVVAVVVKRVGFHA